jgi:hypothetical protein
LTDKELVEQTRQEVTKHFNPKVLEKRVPVDPVEVEKFYNCLGDIAKRPIELPSHYDRTPIKAH